jgi:hypothetical protein
MEDSHRYGFHIRPSTDGNAEAQVVPCTPERIEQIKRCSVLLKQRIKDAENCEKIPLETDDAADINFETLRYLVEDLPLVPGIDLGPIKPNDLSKYCNAFWKYQWMPESATILWAKLDQSGLQMQSQRGTGSERCWQQQTSPQSQERLYIINIAIVFGLDENLRERTDRELRHHFQTVIWNSNLDAQLKTSVGFLHRIKGCIDMTKLMINR